MSAEPLEIYICHCRECQRQSASAFGISVIVPASVFTLRQGRLATWSRPTDSGKVLDCMFCVVCGTRIRHSERGGQTISVKGGSLDQPPDLTGVTHIWTSRALPGVVIPHEVKQFAEEPP